MPRPASARKSATVTLIVDPARRRRDADKGKENCREKTGEEEECKSRKTTPLNEILIFGHIHVEANNHV